MLPTQAFSLVKSTMWRRTGPAPCSVTRSRRGHSERSTVAGVPDGARLLIGSVKTNLGHLEAAAGVAGFIKTVLAVQHGQIPRTLNYQMPNPHIPFQELHLKVVDEEQEWPVTGRVRRAGVSSFGFGGTNAHVVVEQAPESVGVSGSVVSVPVSCRCARWWCRVRRRIGWLPRRGCWRSGWLVRVRRWGWRRWRTR